MGFRQQHRTWSQGQEPVSTGSGDGFLPAAVSRRSRVLLIQQELFYGVWQRQRGNQMESVFAKRSSHGHAAQIEQGPGDTWNAWEERERQRERLNASPNPTDQRLAVRTSGAAPTLAATSHLQRRAGPGEEGLVICSTLWNSLDRETELATARPSRCDRLPSALCQPLLLVPPRSSKGV